MVIFNSYVKLNYQRVLPTVWTIVEHSEIVRVRNPSQRSNRRKRTCDSGTAITASAMKTNCSMETYEPDTSHLVMVKYGKVMQSVLCLGPQRQTGTLWNFSGLFLEESSGVHLRGLLHSQKSSKPEHLDHLDLHNVWDGVELARCGTSLAALKANCTRDAKPGQDVTWDRINDADCQLSEVCCLRLHILHECL